MEEEEVVKEDRKGKGKLAISQRNKGFETLVGPFKGGIKISELVKPVERVRNGPLNPLPGKLPNIPSHSVESKMELTSRLSQNSGEGSETTRYVPFKFHMKPK